MPQSRQEAGSIARSCLVTAHLCKGHHGGSPACVLPSSENSSTHPLKHWLTALCKHFFPQITFEGKRLVKGRAHGFALVLRNLHAISCHCWGVPLLDPNSQGKELCYSQMHRERCPGGCNDGLCCGLWALSGLWDLGRVIEHFRTTISRPPKGSQSSPRQTHSF